MNSSTLTEVLKLKLLRLRLGENEQTLFDFRRLNEASSLEEALRQLNNFWGTAYIDPLYDQFATCSVSITYSYEGTAIIDPSKKNNFPPTATGEGSSVGTEFQVTPTSSIVPLTDA